MKSLKELADPQARAALVDEALSLSRQFVQQGTAGVGRGVNSGVLGQDGDAAANVDAWFENAAWPK